MYKVYFKNVGRNDKSWDAKCENLDYDWFYSQVRNNAKVMSSDLEFALREDSKMGDIYAGFYKIGEFEIVFQGGLK